MTGLRISKIGPAELLLLIWSLNHINIHHIKKSDTFGFFAVFIFSMILGSIVCMIWHPEELDKAGLFTWIYLAVIAIAFYEGLSENELSYNERLLYIFSFTALIWYSFLYLYSISVGRYFLGAPLWYGNRRFSGGGTNPHQVAVLLSGIIFVFIREASKHRHILMNLAFALMCFYLMTQVQSSTGILAMFLGILIFVYSWLMNLDKEKKYFILVLMTALIIVVIMLTYNSIYRRLYLWVASDSNGLGRIEIFSSIMTAFSKSPLVGLGPGAHALDGIIEFHNTYLEIIAATGIVGSAAFIVYTIKSFIRLVKADWTLIPVMVGIYGYGLAGFAMRRLAYWGIFVFILVIAEGKLANANVMEGEVLKNV